MMLGVGYYWGRMYASCSACCFCTQTLSKVFRITQSEWLEKETTGNLGQDEFYSLTLEIPACSIGGYYLLYVRDSVKVHLLSSWV